MVFGAARQAVRPRFEPSRLLFCACVILHLYIWQRFPVFQVVRAIDGIGRTELCRADVDVIDQINALFPTEQSLSQLDTVMHSIEDEIFGLDCQLAELVETHGKAGVEGDQALNEVTFLILRMRSVCSMSWKFPENRSVK